MNLQNKEFREAFRFQCVWHLKATVLEQLSQPGRKDPPCSGEGPLAWLRKGLLPLTPCFVPASASGLQCYGCNVMVGSRSVNTGCSSPEVITCPRSHQGFKHRFCIKIESVDAAVVQPKGLDAFPWNPELVAGWDVGQWCRLCFCSHRKGTAAWGPQSLACLRRGTHHGKTERCAFWKQSRQQQLVLCIADVRLESRFQERLTSFSCLGRKG
ncbi:uncharacterized protein LOC107326134 isoform X2 [Python bivittatus]|uniref:Uncharacterized protein LOC107326134 isoform X2 n=1 Tax=Python bivittatus TaxID=176946 RepID=A0A9F5IN63_PYTBI|nr:uncharacterized protein LOC107326134 isoform X2 [Python bivittatus]